MLADRPGVRLPLAALARELEADRIDHEADLAEQDPLRPVQDRA